ncbi:recombinase family protein [Mycobacterium sp. MBM]|nr:recombinase family protein [Mycobacterium sp. MBM]
MPANATAIRPRRRRRPQLAANGFVVAYLRVSTGEQAESGAGLAAQRTAITNEAARRGWTIVDWYADEGISGGKGIDDRPGLAAAVDAVESGQASTLVAAKLDRLSRSVLDTALLTDRAQRLGWKLFTCDVAVDTTTPAGEAQAGMMTVFSQYERRLIGQRTREALAEKRAAGVRLGRPSVLPIEVVQRILDMRAAGLSYPKICAVFNAEQVPTARGGSQWYPATVRNVERGQDAAGLR